MSVRGNTANLRIAKEADTTQITALLARAKGRIRLSVEERDVPMPRVNLLLHQHCALELALSGRGVFVHLPILWHGTERIVRGEIGTMFEPDVVLPRGTLAAWAKLAA